jgi:TPR repeat protein
MDGVGAEDTAAFDEAVRLDSSDASYFYNRGLAYDLIGEYVEAMADYAKAAEMGSAEAMNMLAILLDVFGDGDSEAEATVAECYRKAAEQGNASGQYHLGDCYMTGTGVPKDGAKAAEWYRKAAEQGEAMAQCQLSYCYEKGVGLPVDMTKAFEWCRKSAVQGFDFSQFELGRFYRDGLGVAVDIAQARLWFEKAAAQGIKGAQAVLRRWRVRERGPWLPFSEK